MLLAPHWLVPAATLLSAIVSLDGSCVCSAKHGWWFEVVKLRLSVRWSTALRAITFSSQNDFYLLKGNLEEQGKSHSTQHVELLMLAEPAILRDAFGQDETTNANPFHDTEKCEVNHAHAAVHRQSISALIIRSSLSRISPRYIDCRSLDLVSQHFRWWHKWTCPRRDQVQSL